MGPDGMGICDQRDSVYHIDRGIPGLVGTQFRNARQVQGDYPARLCDPVLQKFACSGS